MPVADFTKRELELIFGRIDEKLEDIRSDIRETNKHFDGRLSKLEVKVAQIDNDVREISTFKSKALAVWSVGIVVVGAIVQWLVSRMPL